MWSQQRCLTNLHHATNLRLEKQPLTRGMTCVGPSTTWRGDLSPMLFRLELKRFKGLRIRHLRH